MSTRFLTGFTLLLLLLRVWLYRRRAQPLPTTGVSFQATQDIFSFCYPVFPFPHFPAASLPAERDARP